MPNPEEGQRSDEVNSKNAHKRVDTRREAKNQYTSCRHYPWIVFTAWILTRQREQEDQLP